MVHFDACQNTPEIFLPFPSPLFSLRRFSSFFPSTIFFLFLVPSFFSEKAHLSEITAIIYLFPIPGWWNFWGKIKRRHVFLQKKEENTLGRGRINFDAFFSSYHSFFFIPLSTTKGFFCTWENECQLLKCVLRLQLCLTLKRRRVLS